MGRARQEESCVISDQRAESSLCVGVVKEVGLVDRQAREQERLVVLAA
jgi:hypothetical protein